MLGGLGVPELIIILLVVLVIFGPKNLPKLGASLGKTVKNIREGMDSADDKPKKDPAKIEAEDVVVEASAKKDDDATEN
jgi:sec-independent protein translocase protein TatA